jgi:hypothetical protein
MPTALPTSPGSQDLRRVLDDLLVRFAALPDDAWEAPAAGLEWTCRDTLAHVLDDFGFYAMQLSGVHPPQTGYIELLEPAPWRDGSPPIVFWPDPETGTRGILSTLDAVGGLLVAVTATAPPERRGFHPWGLSDRTGFAAMGIVEAVAHAHDILAAQDVGYAADADTCDRVLDRLFPDARRTGDPWHDLLAATGRTPQTRGTPWRWDASVRES